LDVVGYFTQLIEQAEQQFLYRGSYTGSSLACALQGYKKGADQQPHLRLPHIFLAVS
jgi:hypothetical protein